MSDSMRRYEGSMLDDSPEGWARYGLDKLLNGLDAIAERFDRDRKKRWYCSKEQHVFWGHRGQTLPVSICTPCLCGKTRFKQDVGGQNGGA
jgi:hypothetical protein